MTLLVILIMLVTLASLVGAAFLFALLLYGIAWVLVRGTLLAIAWWQTREH
jgi:hypothetical protein